MTDQTKAALVAFQNHVLDILASNPAKRHSPKVAAIDIDRFLAAHRTELAIKDGTWPEDKDEFGRLAAVAQNGNTGEHYSELGPKCSEVAPAIETVDRHLDAVLRASGSGLRNYSFQKTIDAMRGAMIEAMRGTS